MASHARHTAQPQVQALRLSPGWDDLLRWLDDPARRDGELRDFCRRLDLVATGSMATLRQRLRAHLRRRAATSSVVPEWVVPESWSPALSLIRESKASLKRHFWPLIVFDRDVLKLVAPAYAVPLAGIGLAAAGIGAAAVWPFLFVPAVGLHVLITANVASRKAADERDGEAETEPDLVRLQTDLSSGFSKLRSTEGMKALQDLVYEYAQVQPVLTRRRLTDSVVVEQLPLLAAETFRQGLSVLQDALVLMQATTSEDRQRLEAENADLEKEIAALGAHETQAARVKIRRERLASNEELLELIDKQQARVDELLYQSDRCGASLHRTRMELAALRADSSEGDVSSVVGTLRLTISHARGVQDEMKRLTSGETMLGPRMSNENGGEEDRGRPDKG